MSKQRTHAGPRPKKTEAQRPVSKPGDRHEREAERAAEIVARGGSVSSWAFSAVPASAPDPVQRQEVVKEKTDEEKKQEMVKKTSEAALATPQGQAVKEAVLKDPLVKKAKDIVTSTPGIIATGAAAAGGVAALAATGKELPIQPPEIPLEKISKKFEGASAQLTYEGPVNKPTFVGLTLTFKEQAPKGKRKDEPSPIAADTARLKAQQEMLKPESQKQAEKKEADEWVQAWVAQQRFQAPAGVTIPLLEPQPGEKKEEKKEEKKPAQPAPASPSSAPPAHAEVDGALSTPGRPIDPSTRRAMEARFGYDFSSVRVHDDARSAATAAGIDAAAFTVGEDVVFGTGRYDPSSPAGRRLLAHELAHVVQQAGQRGGAGGPLIQRRSVWESLGILLGIEEGTWSDRELQDYLTLIGSTGKIEGDYDSDNKARAIVRRWKAAARGYGLTHPQKVLLIREMLDGPTLDDDEEAILDLLERSDPADLHVVLGPGGVSLKDLESDINGSERKRLDSFVVRRFRGGRDAVLAGRIDIIGEKAPVAAPAPAQPPGFDKAALDAEFDSSKTADELIALVDALPDADRTTAIHYLVTVRRPRQLEAIDKLVVEREGVAETETATREDYKKRIEASREELLKTERVLLHFYRRATPVVEAELRLGTSPSDPARTDELRQALRPTAAKTQFEDKLPGESQSYAEKLRERIPKMVNDYYEGRVVGRGRKEHSDAKKVHKLTEFEGIAGLAKNETDRVFGHFYNAKDKKELTVERPGKPGVVHDRFKVWERRFRQMTKKDRVDWAKIRLFYFFQTNAWVRRLNQHHGAQPEFDEDNKPNNEAAIVLEGLATEFTADKENVRRLNEITRNWRAGASGGDILIQIFRGETPEEDRLLFWQMFQIFIHEYLHTLVHLKYEDYAVSFGTQSNEYNTLNEGAVSLLTEIVWENVEPRVADLRDSVEPSIYKDEPPIKVPHVSQTGRYASYTEALQLVDLTSIEALYAAYFLGLVDRIGGPPDGSTP